jgi:nitroimidazol reductase NimA-like FMN-containing flavoprotein (pyridoxamine 5'-phosphate oxidase superfamily)
MIDVDAPLAAARIRGPWSPAEVVAFLEAERSPLHLALHGERGFPLVVSLWFRHAAGALWCATHATSLVARRLARDDRVAFEVSTNDPPYRGVRGQGRVERLPAEGGRELEALLRRYLGGTDSSLARWLLSRADGEVALRIVPDRILSWDFTARMGDAGA